MRSQLATARLALATLLLGASVAAFAVAGVRLDLFSYAQGYQIIIAATGLGLGALGAALVWCARALKHNDGTAKCIGLTALVGALLLLYPPLSTFGHRLLSPPIHDFTTDTENPPRFVALLKQRVPGDNSPIYNGAMTLRFQGETQTLDYVLHDHYRDILKPHSGFAIGSKNPVATFFRRDLAAARRAGWTIVDTSEKDGRIEATVASFWFGRISDIVILVRAAGQGARTDLRVQSRSDVVDDGANAAHGKRFFRILAE